MNSFKVLFCFTLVASSLGVPTGYGYETSHDHQPQQQRYEEYQEEEQQHYAAPEHSESYYDEGQDSYGHADGGESKGEEFPYGHHGDSHDDGEASQDHDSHHDYHHHPSYKYEYGVTDPKTGHQHSAWEHRDGDVVHGEYSLDEADGTKRIVKYTSDKKNGFNAVVERIGEPHYDHHHGHQEEHHH